MLWLDIQNELGHTPVARVRRVCTCCTHHAALASPVVPAVFAGRTLWTGWLNVASSHRCEPSNSGCIFSESYAHQPVSHIAQAQVSESATVATLERPKRSKTRARGKTGLNLLSLSLLHRTRTVLSLSPLYIDLSQSAWTKQYRPHAI